MKNCSMKFIIFGVFASIVSVNSIADTCRSARSAALKQNMQAAKQNICSQMDTSVNVEDSPYLYKSPDAGCDLGLSLPGLPNFGSVGLEGIDSCRILKSVTGDFVKEVNRELQDAIDVASPISEDQDIDLNDALEERIEAARSEESGRSGGGDSSSNNGSTSTGSTSDGVGGTGTILNMNDGM